MKLFESCWIQIVCFLNVPTSNNFGVEMESERKQAHFLKCKKNLWIMKNNLENTSIRVILISLWQNMMSKNQTEGWEEHLEQSQNRLLFTYSLKKKPVMSNLILRGDTWMCKNNA